MEDARIKLYRKWYYAVWRDGGTRRVALRTQDRAAAEQALADLLKKPIGDTVGEIMEAYLEELRARATDHARAEAAWKALKDHFAPLRPDQVTREQCRAYTAARLLKRRQAGTINKELRTLRAGLRWANKATPAQFEMPSPPDPKDRHLTREEAKALIAACHAPHVRLFVILALATAGRSKALLELTWTRVDFERGQIRLRGEDALKRKGRATVPINGMAREALEQAWEARLSPYVIEYAEGPVLSIKKAFARAVERAELPGRVTPHTLRHTAAVWMAEAGTSMSKIAQYLGHSDDRVTQRVYARYSPDYLRDASSALDLI